MVTRFTKRKKKKKKVTEQMRKDKHSFFGWTLWNNGLNGEKSMEKNRSSGRHWELQYLITMNNKGLACEQF